MDRGACDNGVVAAVHDDLSSELIAWIGEQPMFFVATAPSGDDGHVNLSPKGYDSSRVLAADRVGLKKSQIDMDLNDSE